MESEVLKNGTPREPSQFVEAERKLIDLPALKKAIAAADPNAVLVGHNVIRRVLQSQYKISPLSARAPKESCYVVDRQILFREVEQDELELGSDRILPPTVVLIAKPTSQELLESRDVVLRRYWRRLFEAHIHLTLRERMAEGKLMAADIRARIEAIGHAEFEEIRTVLDQEMRLLTPKDEISVYLEFIVYYLELRYFLNNLRATYFPAIRDFDLIDALIAKDLDAETLFHRTRPEGAPHPEVRTDMHSDESRDYFLKVFRQAARAKKANDLVRAAILYTKAARVAPAAETESTRQTAHRCLEELIQNLREPLKLDAETSHEWIELLPSLLDKADQGTWPDEARLLMRLQNIWLEHESPSISIDVVGYIVSAGRKALERELSGLQVVRATNHLRAAIEDLTLARIGNPERQRLAALLHKAVERSEEMLRERFRPTLEAAFYDANLIPQTPPEKVAQAKIIEELLDRISEQGFFTFSDLRDCLSRNQLKLADLPDPHAFWNGNPLLHLDRRLADQLEGVYRHGEFYLRWLESGGCLLFGTKLGRFVTQNLLLPFGGAALVLRGGEMIFSHLFGGKHPSAAAEDGVEVVANAVEHVSAIPIWVYPLLGLLFFMLMHSQPLREFIANWSIRIYTGLRLFLYEWPVRLVNHPLVQRLRRSWLVCMTLWFVIHPLIVCGVLYLYLPMLFATWYATLPTLVAAAIILNSRFAKYVGQGISEMAVFIYSWFRFDLIRGLIWFTSSFFKQVTNAMEIVLYTVDEWLRFRGSQSLLSKVLRGILSVLWLPVGFLIRLYFVVLVETTINPIKLPFSSLAYKFLLLYPPYLEAATFVTYDKQLLESFMPAPLALVLAVPLWVTFWFLPGAFVFLLWEMKENWKLFAANRPKLLQPVSIGHHGETVLQLLKPGFHSGVIPRAFARLRQAERLAYRTNNWRSARTYRQYLKEVARWVQVFVERELLALLRQSKSWGNQPVFVRQPQLSCKRIRILLAHSAHPGSLLEIDLEDRAGWLMASMPDPGWLRHLASEQLEVVNSALAGFYKMAGVDFVQEQLRAALPPDVHEFDISDRYLIVWNDATGEKRIAYDLRLKQEQLRPRSYMGKIRNAPTLDARRVFFSRIPLTWKQWVACWRMDADGVGHPRLLSQGPEVQLLASTQPKTLEIVIPPEVTVRTKSTTVVNA